MQGLSEGLHRLRSQWPAGVCPDHGGRCDRGHCWVSGGHGLGAPAGQNLRPRLTEWSWPCPGRLRGLSSTPVTELGSGPSEARAQPRLFLAPVKLLPVGGGRPGPGQGRGEGCGPVGPWSSGPSSPWSRDPRQAPQMASSVAK